MRKPEKEGAWSHGLWFREYKLTPEIQVRFITGGGLESEQPDRLWRVGLVNSRDHLRNLELELDSEKFWAGLAEWREMVRAEYPVLRVKEELIDSLLEKLENRLGDK